MDNTTLEKCGQINVAYKNKYAKYKSRIKFWEYDFKGKNGRLPNKNDIKSAEESIQEAYKMYWKIKMQMFNDSIEEQKKSLTNKNQSNNQQIKGPGASHKMTFQLSQNKIQSPSNYRTSLNKSLAISMKEEANILNLVNNIIVDREIKDTENADLDQENCMENLKIKNENKKPVSKTINFTQLMQKKHLNYTKNFKEDWIDRCIKNSTVGVEYSDILMKMHKPKPQLVQNEYVSSFSKISDTEVELSTPDSFKANHNLETNDTSYNLNKQASINSNLHKIVSAEEKVANTCINTDIIPMDVDFNDDDDDFIEGSDTEHSVTHKKNLSIKIQKHEDNDEFIEGSDTENPVSHKKNVHMKIQNQEPSSTNSFTSKEVPQKNNTKTKVSNTLTSNFVKINLKKKVYVRGKKSFNFQKYKRSQWKQKKKFSASNESSKTDSGVDNFVCFQCGESGHFKQQCPQLKEDALLPQEEMSKFTDFPNEIVLQEKENNLKKPSPQKTLLAKVRNKKLKGSTQSTISEQNQESFDISMLPPLEDPGIQPVYDLEEDGSLKDMPLEVLMTLKKFGHTSFRPGQETAVMRILSGMSTLVTLSTGSGKSLCYQLPAYIYSQKSHCITLVISPLVSLMEDQVSGIPKFVKAACLHTNQTKKVREKVLEELRSGELQILLISPEAIVAGDKSGDFGFVLKSLPPVAFACIDEAHCISQWSHNFRPSYLMICKILKEKIGVKTILALSATATKRTAENLIEIIGIPDGVKGIVSNNPLPSNLMLSISDDEYKDTALMELLSSKKMSECNSIIIYCTRRETCTTLAKLLQHHLGVPSSGTKKVRGQRSGMAEAYHAGLSAAQRKAVQKGFMNGSIKIVVATIAFGMGINKSDIRSVIHYNIPSTFEEYVQEIGRAGRDGELAHCHLFINTREYADKYELRRHIYTNSLDRQDIRQLIRKIFKPCTCNKDLQNSNDANKCDGHEIGLDIDGLVKELDIPEETIATLLCYLELHPKKFLKKTSKGYLQAKIYSHKGIDAINEACLTSLALKVGVELAAERGVKTNNSVEFSVTEVASKMHLESGEVKRQLKNLEWKAVNTRENRRTTISVTFSTLGFIVKTSKTLTSNDLDEAFEYLTGQNKYQEKLSLAKLELMYNYTKEISFNSVAECLDMNDEINDRSEKLKNLIRSYFETEHLLETEAPVNPSIQDEGRVLNDLRGIICSYTDSNFTGRSIARIFHGIQSPNYPAFIWARCRYWRAHISEDFNALCLLATKEILKYKK